MTKPSISESERVWLKILFLFLRAKTTRKQLRKNFRQTINARSLVLVWQINNSEQVQLSGGSKTRGKFCEKVFRLNGSSRYKVQYIVSY